MTVDNKDMEDPKQTRNEILENTLVEILAISSHIKDKLIPA